MKNLFALLIASALIVSSFAEEDKVLESDTGCKGRREEDSEEDSEEEKKLVVAKIKATKLQKYGNENYRSLDKFSSHVFKKNSILFLYTFPETRTKVLLSKPLSYLIDE